jgi:competence protein ComEA
MSALPTKRLLVYVAVGLVVLVVGVIGLVAAGRGSQGESAVVIKSDGQGAGGQSAGGTDGVPGGVAAPGATTSGPTTTVAPRVWVQVAGAVNVPGVYHLLASSRVFEAVAAAGGFTDDADEQAVALAAQLSDGCRVYVPRVGETAPGVAVGPTGSSGGVTGGSAGSGTAGGPVSLNNATLQELDSLPGIGPSLAQQIIAYRQAQGPFTSVDQLTDVPGIGPAKLELIRPLVVL